MPRYSDVRAVLQAAHRFLQQEPLVTWKDIEREKCTVMMVRRPPYWSVRWAYHTMVCVELIFLRFIATLLTHLSAVTCR